MADHTKQTLRHPLDLLYISSVRPQTVSRQHARALTLTRHPSIQTTASRVRGKADCMAASRTLCLTLLAKHSTARCHGGSSSMAPAQNAAVALLCAALLPMAWPCLALRTCWLTAARALAVWLRTLLNPRQQTAACVHAAAVCWTHSHAVWFACCSAVSPCKEGPPGSCCMVRLASSALCIATALRAAAATSRSACNTSGAVGSAARQPASKQAA